MSLPVPLESVTEEMEMLSEEWAAYINRQTGQLVTIIGDDLDPEVDALEAEESEDYIALPSTFDIDDYESMQRFGDSIENESIAGDIASAIRGSGAFLRTRSIDIASKAASTTP